MRVLVTGGGGFIGSHVVDRLIELAEEEGDEAVLADAEKRLLELKAIADKRQIEALLSRPAGLWALIAVAALVGLWLFNRELLRSGIPGDAYNIGLAGVVGGLAGAIELAKLVLGATAASASYQFAGNFDASSKSLILPAVQEIITLCT